MMLQAKAHFGDGKRGSVAGKNCLRLDHSIQAGQQLFLGFHIFGHGFDEQIHIGGSGFLLNEDMIQNVLHGVFGHFALGHTLLQRFFQLILMALGRFFAAGIQQHGVALACKNLSDARAHGACTKNSNFHNHILLL